MRALPLLFLALLLPACVPDQRPATGAEAPTPIAEPYRGRPVALALSADGRYVAVAFETLGQGGLRHGGFVVLDGAEGRPLYTRPASMGRLRGLAVTDDGTRVVTVWACNHRGVWDRGCTGQRVIETDFRGNLESVRFQFDGEIHGAWQDPGDASRLLALMGPSHVFPDGEAAPCCRLRLFAIPRGAALGNVQQLADWDIAGLAATAPAVPLPGGALRLPVREIAGGARRELLLRPGAPPEPVPEPALPPSVAPPILALAREPGRALAVISEGPRGQLVDEVVLAGGRRLGLRGEVPLVAISADGRRGAAVVLPPGAEDPQPALHLLDLADPAARPQRSAALAESGLGRSWMHAPAAAANLLPRLRALAESGWLPDPARAGEALGLRLRSGDLADTPTDITVEGPLAPFGLDSAYAVREVRDRAGVWQAELRLALHAGPCVTAAAAERAFGPPARIDPPRAEAPRPRQPRGAQHHMLRDGAWARVEFNQASCAAAVAVGYVPP